MSQIPTAAEARARLVREYFDSDIVFIKKFKDSLDNAIKNGNNTFLVKGLPSTTFLSSLINLGYSVYPDNKNKETTVAF